MPQINWTTNLTALWSAVRNKTVVPITGQGAAGQTANLLELKDSTGAVKFAVSPVGVPSVGSTILPQALEITINFPTNASITNQWFFTANATYQIVAVREVHTTAGTDAGAVLLNLTIDRGTGALISGANVLLSSINLKGAANTVQLGTLSGTVANLQLAVGDRMAVYVTGVTTAVAGVVVTVQLIRI